MSLAGVSLRDLEYVVAVADRASFVAAAEHCHVSQPSLSSQIRKVEGWLGTPIFERTSRRVIVTATGSRFVDQARRVLLEARQLRPLAQSSQRPFGGTLHLAAIATLGPYFFPRILPALRARYGDVRFVLGEGLTEVLLDGLKEGNLDAVLLSPPVEDAGLEAEGLFREPFLLACPGGHSAEAAPEQVWRNLPAEQRLLLDEGHCLRDQALAMCSDVGKRDRHATSLETLKYMVSAGEGCTLIPALATDRNPGIRYLPLTGRAYGRRIDLAWRRSDTRRAEFLELACQLRRVTARKLPNVVPTET